MWIWVITISCLICSLCFLVNTLLAIRQKELAMQAQELEIQEKQKILDQIDQVASSAIEMSPNELFSLMGQVNPVTKKRIMSRYDFNGVYILHNTDKDMYYVGQSVQVIHRVNQHLTGQGNDGVYTDYKDGDAFLIRMIGLKESNYDTLNHLERDMIEKYDAYNTGYNNTKGNRG